jgi:hypothetical protein
VGAWTKMVGFDTNGSTGVNQARGSEGRLDSPALQVGADARVLSQRCFRMRATSLRCMYWASARSRRAD